MGIYSAKVGKKYYTANYYDDKLEFNVFEVEKNTNELLRLINKKDINSRVFLKRIHTEKDVEKTYGATKKKAVEKLIQYYEFSVEELVKDIHALRKWVKIV